MQFFNVRVQKMKSTKSKGKGKCPTKNTKKTHKKSPVKCPEPFLLSSRKTKLDKKIQGMFDFMTELKCEIAEGKRKMNTVAGNSGPDPDEVCHYRQYQAIAKRHLEILFATTFRQWRQRWFDVISRKTKLVRSKDLLKYAKEFTDTIDAMRMKKPVKVPHRRQIKSLKAFSYNHP